MTTLTDWLTAAKARADGATEGPWVQFPSETDVAMIEQSPRDGSIIGGGPIAQTTLPRDAAFIAAARAEYPAMADALLAVLAVLDRADANPGADGERKVHTVVVWQAIATALGVTA